MSDAPGRELTPRQEAILVRVVEKYVETGAPVGSKTLVAHGLNVSSSTVRNDLSQLEEFGFLSHPHTSAGRVPTDLGYRFFVDRLMESIDPRGGEAGLALDLSPLPSEGDAALQGTTAAAGGVMKRLISFGEPVDAGLAEWGGEYLNDQLAGRQLSARLLRSCFEDP